jgi:hypothetical protein
MVMARDVIFISHATPADNDFTKWLALKLIGLGYNVWCDILSLNKGVDTWRDIEPEIRENSCRLLVVLSKISNQSDGVLKEISVAEKVKKDINDDGFIIPLRIDISLSYAEINIQLNRLNAIDFTQSWIKGLTDLLKSLEKNKIPKYPENIALSNELYTKIFLHERTVIQKDEIYDSNWFRIKSFPQYLYFHKIDTDDNNLFDKSFYFPTIRYKDTICTFSSDIDYKYKDTGLIDTDEVIKIPVRDILDYKSFSPFIESNECRLFLVRLVNDGFNKMMNTKEFKTYFLTNKTAYWFEKNCLPKDKINGVQIVGKRIANNWHFGISGYIKLKPFTVLILTSHIFFTTDGKTLIPSKERQHKLRIKQGKNWHNKIWRNKLMALIDYLTKGEKYLIIPVGKNEMVRIHSRPLKLLSHITYTSPKTDILEEDIVEIFDDEDEDEDIDK